MMASSRFWRGLTVVLVVLHVVVLAWVVVLQLQVLMIEIYAKPMWMQLQVAPGMTRAEVVERLGQPTRTRSPGYAPKGHVLNYRLPFPHPGFSDAPPLAVVLDENNRVVSAFWDRDEAPIGGIVAPGRPAPKGVADRVGGPD